MASLDLPIVAVIGGGFSGLMTALHLVRAGTVRVRLIEKSACFGQGAAYGTANPDHLLNVRASNMSAWPDQPDHFAQWLIRRRPEAGAFASRGDYGLYLQDLLATATQGPEAAGRLTLVADQTVALVKDANGWRLSHASGARERVDAAILAVGNPPPATPAGVAPDVASSPLYHADPWHLPLLASRPDMAPTLLIGSGLTMVDVALSLARVQPGRPLITLSRRGLLPLAHAATSPLDALSPPHDIAPAALLGWLKARARHHGWREVIDALRPHTQTIWRTWSAGRRARFLRHARAYWDVHRHRLAPEVAARMRVLIEDGTLTQLTGRIQALTGGPRGLRLLWRPRGQTHVKSLDIGRAINCTGPASAHHDPLLDAMSTAGLVRPDQQSLGLDVDAQGRLIRQDGAAHPRLFAVGPVTRGAFWEITAVPDIRLQAALVAQSVLTALNAPHELP
jgi:uncharacterized NAD(P)/FAD-binding protein YdhS